MVRPVTDANIVQVHVELALLEHLLIIGRTATLLFGDVAGAVRLAHS